MSHCCGHEASAQPPPATPSGQYTCPMHLDVITDGPGDCPFCGMALEPMSIDREALRVGRDHFPDLGVVHRIELYPVVPACAGAFVGDTSFTYTLENAEGERDDATVHVKVYGFGEKAENSKSSRARGLPRTTRWR